MSELPLIPFARLSQLEKKIDVKKLPSLHEQIRAYIFDNAGVLNAKQKERQEAYDGMIQEVSESVAVDPTSGQLNISINATA